MTQEKAETQEQGNTPSQLRLILAEARRREQQRQRLLAAVMAGYQLAPKAYAKRGQLHAFVCERLRLVGNNDEVLAIRDALRSLGVLGVNHHGTRLYRGIQAVPPA